MTLAGRAAIAYRVVLAFTLWALLYKWRFLLWSSREYFDIPLDHPLFPAVFESPVTFLGAYASALVLLALAVVVRPGRLSQWLAGGALVAVSILALHLGGYNDATFTTAWWALVWAVWFGGRIAYPTSRTVAIGARLALAIASLILLGGAVGKWTPEYWSGRVLYEIYFLDRDFWLFNYLRNAYDAPTLREIAAWYSRAVIVVESVAGLGLWLLSPRLGAAVGLSIFVGITVLSNPLLASVTLSMIGLSAVGFAVPVGRDTAR